jgi:hypothetical protein
MIGAARVIKEKNLSNAGLSLRIIIFQRPSGRENGRSDRAAAADGVEDAVFIFQKRKNGEQARAPGV